MEFLKLTREEANSFFNKKTLQELKKVLKYIFTLFPKEDRNRLAYFYRGKKNCGITSIMR